jgi:hypothetical protein
MQNDNACVPLVAALFIPYSHSHSVFRHSSFERET